MGLPYQRREAELGVQLQELSIQLASLNICRPEILGDQITRLIGNHLGTDRVSLLVSGRRAVGFSQAFSIGFEHTGIDWNVCGKVSSAVSQTRQQLVVYDIREHPELLSDRAEKYKTDAFAAFPLVAGRNLLGVLCISNLSTQQIMQLENLVTEVQLLTTQLAQHIKLISEHMTSQRRRKTETSDEFSLLRRLIDNLDQSLDTRNVFTIFHEVVSQYIPVDMLAVIHDSFSGSQQGIVSVHRAVCRADVDGVFCELASQWQRRHRHAPVIGFADARLSGSELLSKDESVDLRLEGTEIFPILIDNDLFGLVALGTTRDTLADKRRLQVFSVLVHHLLLHLKKSLLLELNQEMQTVDGLTGLYNERHFYQMMEREFDRASRYNVPISLLFVDVDHFKDVNETYGFETGDILLREISQILMENTRSTDFCSRYSGERFVVVLPETHYKNAEILANRLRRFVENHSFYIANTNVFIKVTVSVGVASYLDHKPASLAQFIEFADTALYFAKRNGRNRVVGYSYVINLMIGDTDHES